MKSKILRNTSFEDIWKRLSEKERSVCCTCGYGPDSWETFIAWNPTNIYSADKSDSLEHFREFVQRQQKEDRRIFGYLSYDVGYKLLNIQPRAKHDLNFPDILFYSFSSWIRFVEDSAEIFSSNEETLLSYEIEIKDILQRPFVKDGFSEHNSSELKAHMTPDLYAEGYKKIKKYIFEGDVYQMNFTHRLEGVTSKNPRTLFIDMCEKNKVAHLAYMEGDGFEILSASPERFVKISADRTIETFPIKGTRPRGKTEIDDKKQKLDLINSQKETAELNMITDLLRNDLGRVSEIGSVEVVEKRIVYPYPTVWHTHSHIKGKLLPSTSSLEALLSMFPGGSITGCPKKRAVEIIDEVEPFMRSVYTGSIGYINSDDSLDFNIAIRTFLKKGNKVYLSVGGGIVYDSQEKDEYKETFDKARSFLDVL
ncbi:MAG: anthranilate synthase component I family protein [Candidatus Paceibacterota bacterium]